MSAQDVAKAKAGVTATAPGGTGAVSVNAAGQPVNSQGLPALGMSAGHLTAIHETPFALGPTPAPGQGGMPASGIYEKSIPPIYFDGDQYVVASMDPVQLAQLQTTMRNAGVLTADYQSGVQGDPATLAAMTELMSEANQTGYTYDQVLQQRLNAPKVPKAPSKPFVADAFLKPDPATLKESVRQLMQQVIGPDRQPSDAELADLTARLGSLDRAQYDAKTVKSKADYEAGAPGTQDGAVATSLGGDATVPGGSTVQAVDPSSALADYLRTTYKPEIDMAKGTSDLSKNTGLLQGSFLSLSNAVKSPGY